MLRVCTINVFLLSLIEYDILERNEAVGKSEIFKRLIRKKIRVFSGNCKECNDT